MKLLSLLLCGGCLLLIAADTKDEVKGLLKSLKSSTPQARASAAEELGHLGAIRASDVKAAVPGLIEVLKKDRDPKVRKAAAHALGRIDPDPGVAVPALTAALKDKT